MTHIEILVNFEREINKLNNVLEKPTTNDSLYWLNQAINKFIKLRFNGDLVHNTSYEQNEKRTRDLIKLYKEAETKNPGVISSVDYDSYSIDYPEDLMYVVNENVTINDINGGHVMSTHVFECTADNFMHRINNSLTDFHYHRHRARPLRIRTKDGCKLITDKKYKIRSYTIGYLKTPNEISLTHPNNEYTDFEDSIMYEIIKIAAQMYIENQSDERYKTISSEVYTQE